MWKSFQCDTRKYQQSDLFIFLQSIAKHKTEHNFTHSRAILNLYDFLSSIPDVTIISLRLYYLLICYILFLFFIILIYFVLVVLSCDFVILFILVFFYFY